MQAIRQKVLTEEGSISRCSWEKTHFAPPLQRLPVRGHLYLQGFGTESCLNESVPLDLCSAVLLQAALAADAYWGKGPKTAPVILRTKGEHPPALG